ncbi:hypothetical protein [Novipirellula artificiosorum]|uniref:Uncharacterized protein n=1 Tax=Novipirellula artificiosorum TaxID=2528016 RepID=A0A5C6DKD0_9BACT|nr:hypothetical protein [Novipirellula artificiosorum]TWU37218.1 hypothetical protein Poly41_33460 [Novipirellula artificiosorum]
MNRRSPIQPRLLSFVPLFAVLCIALSGCRATIGVLPSWVMPVSIASIEDRDNEPSPNESLASSLDQDAADIFGIPLDETDAIEQVSGETTEPVEESAGAEATHTAKPTQGPDTLFSDYR